MVEIYGEVALRKTRTPLKGKFKKFNNLCLALASRVPKLSQLLKMSDVKLAVLGSKSTGKSGEFFCLSNMVREANWGVNNNHILYNR